MTVAASLDVTAFGPTRNISIYVCGEKPLRTPDTVTLDRFAQIGYFVIGDGLGQAVIPGP